MALLDFVDRLMLIAHQDTPYGQMLAKEQLMQTDSGIRTQEQQRLAQQEAMQMQQRGQALASALPEQLRGFEGLVQATGEVDPALDLFKAQQEAQMLQQQIAARREAAAQAASAPTALQKDYQFLLQQGYDQKTAIDMLRKGVNVNVGAGENEFQKEMGKTEAEFVTNTLNKMPDIQNRLYGADLVIENLKKGAYVGVGTDAVQTYKTLLSDFTGDPEYAKDAARIDQIKKAFGTEVLAVVKGLGANPSNADRNFANEIASGVGKGTEGARRAAIAMKANALLEKDVAEITQQAYTTGQGQKARTIVNQYLAESPLKRYYEALDKEIGEIRPQTIEGTMPKASGEQAPARKRYNPATGMVE